MIRRLLRRVLRGARDALIGPFELTITDQLARRDPRWGTFICAIEYVNYEGVPGDIMEFGVFAGASLALLAKAQSFNDRGLQRRVVGFDAFKGLPEASEAHAQWRVGDCAQVHGWHPWLPVGAPVTPEATRELFRACELSPPELEIGWYRDTLAMTIPSKYRERAGLRGGCVRLGPAG